MLSVNDVDVHAFLKISGDNRCLLKYAESEAAMINRVNYRNPEKKTDFEIVDIQLFFATRPHPLLEKDARLDFWAILFITDGSGFHSIDFIRHPYKTGDAVFIQRNQVHHFEINPEVKGYLIHINEPFFYRVAGFNGDIFLEFVDKSFGSSVLPFDLSAHSTNRALLDLIYREYSNIDDRFNIELIASLFQGLILSLRAETTTTGKVFLTKEYTHFKTFRILVEKHYADTRNVEAYAQMMNLSTKTINLATRKVAGLSAKQFITNRLILEIKRHLSQGELLTYEIADLLGFDEAANMTGFFSRYEGVSPKDFRNNLIV